MEELIERIKTAQDMLNNSITELLTNYKDIDVNIRTLRTNGYCIADSDKSPNLLIYISKTLLPYQDTLNFNNSSNNDSGEEYIKIFP